MLRQYLPSGSCNRFIPSTELICGTARPGFTAQSVISENCSDEEGAFYKVCLVYRPGACVVTRPPYCNSDAQWLHSRPVPENRDESSPTPPLFEQHGVTWAFARNTLSVSWTCCVPYSIRAGLLKRYLGCTGLNRASMSDRYKYRPPDKVFCRKTRGPRPFVIVTGSPGPSRILTS